MAAAHQLTIGFHGGQVVAARTTDEQLQALLAALSGSSGGGWHELSAEDGSLRLDLAQVAYVRTEGDEHRVGFRA
ncbi:MAG: hypothetical protein ACYDA6_11105 [Solirubrobacteraceae bacterium]